MDKVIMLIWLVSIGIAVLGGIPYLIWMVVTGLKKRWKKLIIQIISPISFFLVLFIGSDLANRAGYKSYIRDVYDADPNLDNLIYEYDSDRSFQGDGYTIEVYKISNTLKDRFKKPDQTLFDHYPKLPSYRSGWSRQRWVEAPFPQSLEMYLDFALSSYDARNETGMIFHHSNIRHALKSKNTYYAFFHKDFNGNPSNIDLFVVDLEKGFVYEINHNT